MNPTVVTLSLSAIASEALNQKLEILKTESLGYLELQSYDLSRLEHGFNFSAKVVILNLPSWSTDHGIAIRRLRAKGYRGHILAIVSDLKAWSEIVQHQPADFYQTTLLEKPYSDADVVGMIRRLLTVHTTAFRAHPRYETEQSAHLRAGETADETPCVLRNVSHGGACLEFNGPVPVKKGGIVHLDVVLTQENKAQSLRGRIVWIQPYRRQAGVEFLPTFAA